MGRGDGECFSAEQLFCPPFSATLDRKPTGVWGPGREVGGGGACKQQPPERHEAVVAGITYELVFVS